MSAFSDITFDIAKVILLWAIVVIVFTKKLDKGENFVKWIIWDLSGLRLIWEKFRPPENSTSSRRPPSTILVWSLGLFGIYIALFGVASQRYENRTDIMETRASAVIAQLTTYKVDRVLERIPKIQNMKCPRKPELLKPSTVFKSLFMKEGRNKDICEFFIDIIETRKDSLNNADMTGIYLKEAQLKEANLIHTKLAYANFVKANLSYAILKEAILINADLREAILRSTNFSSANLASAMLQNCDSTSANFNSANLEQAQFEEAQLYGAGMNDCFLSNANLKKANFGLANLNNSKLDNANLSEVNFVNADLSNTDMTKAFCNRADFSYARLNNSVLVGASMTQAKFVGTDFTDAILSDVDFEEADLSEASGLKVEQLCTTKSLYKTVLSGPIQELIMKSCPHLFDKQ